MTDETRWGPKPAPYTFQNGMRDVCFFGGLGLMAVGIGHFSVYVAAIVVGGLLFGLSVFKL